MAVLPESVRESGGHGNVSQPSSFRGRHMPAPVISLNTELLRLVIHIAPAQCPHFPRSQGCITAKKDANESGRIEGASSLN